MLGLAGLPLGLEFRFLDPVAEAPAGALGPLVVGELGDQDALARVADGATVTTYEWEGVPAEGARFLEANGRSVLPPAGALDVAQDRLAEKKMFRRLGLATPDFAPVGDRGEL
ncbi:MAG TPA: 5-(carboxyamino)imidazole ribonucleotide synthase, partial [Acidimicrobiia bacterium]|nr:5-(carboxyamino)imidazole ribonucleotide synthase [Acidimicrobiia bacterium]